MTFKQKRGPKRALSLTKKYIGNLYKKKLFLKNYYETICEINIQVSSNDVGYKLFKP